MFCISKCFHIGGYLYVIGQCTLTPVSIVHVHACIYNKQNKVIDETDGRCWLTINLRYYLRSNYIAHFYPSWHIFIKFFVFICGSAWIYVYLGRIKNKTEKKDKFYLPHFNYFDFWKFHILCFILKTWASKVGMSWIENADQAKKWNKLNHSVLLSKHACTTVYNACRASNFLSSSTCTHSPPRNIN